MRILIFTFGTRGDVQPYMALGQALQRAGHDVTLSTGQGFDAMIAAHGLTPAPLAVDFKAMLESPEIRDALHSLSGKFRAWKSLKGTFRDLFRGMAALARDVRPDMILGHPKALSASYIAEALGVVFVPTTLQPAFAPTSAFPNFLVPWPDLGQFGNRLSHRAFNWLTAWGQAAPLGDWRRHDLGLTTKAPDLFAGYHPEGLPVPRLHGYSRHIVPKPDDWGEADHVTGYWFLEPDEAWRPPSDLAAFLEAGPPPVYVGFGSMPAEDSEGLTRNVVEALALTGRRGVLATGWGGLRLAGPGRTLFLLDAAPHDWLFPRCSAVVHHGGAGTTHEGLRWGRPSVICPVTVDQPFWGRRVAALGAGPKPLPQNQLTAAALAKAIMDAHAPPMIASAAALGEKLRRENGPAMAVDILSRFAEGSG